MEVMRSKVVLVSDMKCCTKYRHTLPSHVELVTGYDGDGTEEIDSSKKSLNSSTESSRFPSAVLHSGSETVSTIGSVELETLEQIDENLEDEMMEMESEMGVEESEEELSICSDWIVLKPRKKKKEKVQEESSTADLKEPAGPDGKQFESKVPQELIPSGFFKYQDLCKDLPKTPTLEDESLRKRAPSPNSSWPRSDVGMYETTGEDWLWFEGRYLEGGTWEVAAGEDGEYYRMQKQWKEGHWEPAPWLVKKWEKEELELEKERLKKLEEKRKYDEILKREDSPGMDIMNWGFGPVKLTRWMEVLGGISLEDFSKLLTTSLSEKFLEETSEMTHGALEELSAALSDAAVENSVDMVRDILALYFSEDLALAISERIALNAKSATVGSELSGEEESEEGAPEASSTGIVQKTVEVEVMCNVIPDELRNVLLDFVKNFMDDLPSDALEYAVTYFEERRPRMDLIETAEGEDASVESVLKISERRKSVAEPSAYSIDLSDNEITEEQVEMIIKAFSSCWMLKDLGIACYIALIREMYRLPITANSSIRTEDDEADHMYVIESGSFQLTNKHGAIVLKDQGCFGDVSLVGLNVIQFPYDVVALTDGALWCLHKHSFINCTRKINLHRERLMTEMMMSLELFDNLDEDEFYKIIHCTEVQYFQKGDVLFCENTAPMGIYFILFGELKLVKLEETTITKKDGKTKTQKKLKVVRTFSSPAALGHDNVLFGDPWECSCVARSNITEVALLRMDAFERLVGDVDEVMNRPVKEMSAPEVSVAAEVMEEAGEVCGEYEQIEMEEEFIEEEVIHTFPKLAGKKPPDLDDMI